MKGRSLTQDASAIVRVMEIVVMHSEEGPCSDEMLRKIVEDYKGKLVTLEEEYKKKVSEKNDEMGKKDEELTTHDEVITNKYTTLLGRAYQYALLVRTLYETIQVVALREAVIHRSMASAEHETDEEKSLKTRVELIGHIRVLEDDCFATAQETYHSIITQLRIANPGVKLVTMQIGNLHQIVDGKIVAPNLWDGNREEETGARGSQDVIIGEDTS